MTGVQLGYEARCALPHAFDVILGSQLGVGAYRALVENGARRRPGLGLRPAQPQLRSVRHAGRPRDPRDRRSLHPARLRLPAAGAVPRELPARILMPRRRLLPGARASGERGSAVIRDPRSRPGVLRAPITSPSPTAPARAKLGALPCMSSPVRKILPAAQTQNRAVSGGHDDRQADLPGRRGRLASPAASASETGWPAGTATSPPTAGSTGSCSTAVQTKIGNIDRSITGIISDWASFSSLHAEPTAM